MDFRCFLWIITGSGLHIINAIFAQCLADFNARKKHPISMNHLCRQGIQHVKKNYFGNAVVGKRNGVFRDAHYFYATFLSIGNLRNVLRFQWIWRRMDTETRSVKRAKTQISICKKIVPSSRVNSPAKISIELMYLFLIKIEGL